MGMVQLIAKKLRVIMKQALNEPYLEECKHQMATEIACNGQLHLGH